MAAPKLYKFTDANAPVCSGTRGALINILKKCLIEGYGDKTPPGGWTLEFENAEKTIAVFRNNPVTGTGFFLRVNESTSANAYTPSMMGYELMTDIDTGTGSFGAWSYPLTISNAASTAGRPWNVIADDRFFYFTGYPATSSVTLPAKGSYSHGFCFGDVIPIQPDDGFACILALSQHTPTTSYVNNVQNWLGYIFDPTWASASDIMFFARNAAAIPGASKTIHSFSGGPRKQGYTYPASGGTQGAPYTENAPLILVRPSLTDGVAYTVRGWLPGFYFPAHTCPFEAFTVFEDTGKSFFANIHQTSGIDGSVSGPGQFMISLDDWRV